MLAGVGAATLCRRLEAGEKGCGPARLGPGARWMVAAAAARPDVAAASAEPGCGAAGAALLLAALAPAWAQVWTTIDAAAS